MRSKFIAIMPCSFVVKTLTLPGLRHGEKSWLTAMALVGFRTNLKTLWVVCPEPSLYTLHRNSYYFSVPMLHLASWPHNQLITHSLQFICINLMLLDLYTADFTVALPPLPTYIATSVATHHIQVFKVIKSESRKIKKVLATGKFM